MNTAELYCQVLKQLSQNPSPESLSKGWWLLAIMIETFPPPPEFENYLEAFIRTKAPDGQKERYLKMLHASIYGGQRSQPLTESEMSQLLSGHSLRAAAFETKAAYQAPQAALPARAQLQTITADSVNRPAVPIAAAVPASSGGSFSIPTRDSGPSLPPPPPPEEAAAPPPPPPPAQCMWHIAYHPDTNQPYYYHEITGETTWDKPADYFE